MSDHALSENVGAYLLGALDEGERQEFERHLAGCPDCREEVEWLRAAADALPRSVQPFEPPPRLRAALLAEVGADDAARAGPGRLRRSLGAPGRLLTGRGGLRPTVAWAGVAALLAIGAVGGFGLANTLSDDELRTISAQAGKGTVAGAGGTLTMSGDGEKGAILRVTGLPRPGGGDVYQAWVQRDGSMTPEPTFEVGENGRGAVAVPEDLSGADAVLVTRERRGGAPAPTSAPVLSVGL